MKLERPLGVALALTTLVCGVFAAFGAIGYFVFDQAGALAPILAAVMLYTIGVPALFIINRATR